MKKNIYQIKKTLFLTGALLVFSISFLASRKINSLSNTATRLQKKSQTHRKIKTPLNSQIDVQSDKQINSKIINIETEDHHNSIVNNKENRVVIQFSAPWCGACNAVKRLFEEMACKPEFENVLCARVNIDTLGFIARKYNVRGIPTFLFIRDGQVKKQAVGFKSLLDFENDMRNDIRTLLLN